MLIFKNLRCLRIISCWARTGSVRLFLCAHAFLGVGWLAAAPAQGGPPDPNTPYEILVSDPDLAALADGVREAEEKGCRAVELFEWVRREIAYEPYAGGVKGALGTFRSRAGNAVDQAVLLAALLEMADVPWRLVRGDARLSVPDALSWLGVREAGQIAELLSHGVVAYDLVGDNPAYPEAIILRNHVWVEVHVAYFPMGGAAGDDVYADGVRENAPTPTPTPAPGPDAREMWVALDPAVTFHEAPRAVNLDETLGVDSPGFLEIVKKAATAVNDATGFANLPVQTLQTAAENLGESLKTLLASRGQTIGEFLQAPPAPTLAERQALPGNLPYEVLKVHQVAQYDDQDPFAVAAFLAQSSRATSRRSLTIRLRSKNPGGWERMVSIDLPALAQTGGATVCFELIDSPQGYLNDYQNAEEVGVDNAVVVRPRILLDGEDVLNRPDDSVPDVHITLGKEIRLELAEFERETVAVPIVAGGLYKVLGYRTLGPEEAAARGATLDHIRTASNWDAARTHETALGECLDLAGQTALLQAERFSRMAAASLGHTLAGPPARLIAGVEPTLATNPSSSSQVIRKCDLVLHLLDGETACVPRLLETDLTSSRDEVRNVVGLARDAALTAAFEALAGNNALQSATRLMLEANDDAPPLDVNTIAQGSTLPAERVPSGLPAGVSTLLADRLFSCHLVLTDESLHEDPRVGDSDAPAGWAWWEIRSGHSAGTVLAPESALARSASVPVDLCPLDPIHDGPKTRYDALLAKASAWSDQAVQVTAWVESAIPSAASLIHTWLDTADGVREADQAPDPAAVPAAAIALHGAIDAFSKPQITAFFLDPPVLNAAGADPNCVSTLNASVATSSKVVELDFAFEDEKGHSDGANQTETDLDGMQFDVALDLSQMTLAEGPHAVAVRAQTQGGDYSNSRTPSAPASASYIVDNTTPAVSLVGEGTTIDVSGFYSVRGSVADPNLASYVVDCESAPDSWTVLHRATTEIPVTSQLARINTSAHGWTWGEDVDVRVRATDAAGNSTSKQLTLHVLNDDDAPAVALSAKIGADGVREAADVETGDDVFDTLDATLSVTETPAVSEDGQGLSRVRLWIESQSDPSRRFDLIDQTFSAPSDSYGPSTVNFDTFDLSKIAGSYEHWRVAAEAIDVVGNRSTAEIADLKPANQLLRFDAGPRVFATGWSDSVRDCRHTVIVADFDPGQAAPAWTLHIKNAGGATQRAYASSDPGLAPGSFRISWYGNAQGAAGDDSYVPPGVYALELRYGAAPNEKQTVLPIIVAPDQADYAPRVTQLRALNAAQQQGRLLAIPQGEDELSGQELIVSGDYPILEITGAIDQALNAFLDGQGPNPPDVATVPYSEAFWTVDLKSSMMPPTQEDAQDAANNPAARYENLTDRSSWRNVAWGYDWGNTTPTPDGQVVSAFDTAQLSPGYYDVRLWVTDGRGFAHNIVFFIKVVRNADSPDTGTPDAVGKMALSATDMTVPFSGYTAEISRAYDSTDVYAPGALGYGWSLGGIALEVEPYNQGAGEYDEAFVRLPDGRQFFFSNNPPASSPTNNQWATKAAYTKRPFGMSLHRPGASANFHGPDAQTLNCYTAPPNLAPGAPSRAMPLRYTTPDASKTYGPGEVAYLQTEDKTWHIFEWRAGEMLEIIRPDGQTLVFDRDADSSQVVVSDAAGREVKVEVETLKDGRERVTAIVDPAGNRVAYEYDDYGNLLTVTDRSGRKRFYIYDTPEAKQLFPDNPDLTGLNPHFLVDVRVDDDSDGVPQFSHTIAVRSPIDGRKRTVVYKDTIPEPATSDSTVPHSAFPAPHFQDFPGDVSVLQIKYENGLMTGIETVAGGVQIERQFNFGGAGGAEIVRDAATGAQTTVEYDAEHRVTQQTDPYGNATAYAYYAAGNLPGALQKETDPLGVETNYEYPNYQPQYKSFAHMFQSYLDSRIDADSTVLGYPTSAQGGPSKITQDAAGFALATDIAYETDSTKPSAFQPRKITDPLSNETTLRYDATTGKTTNVSFKGEGTTDGAVVANEYYASGQTDLVYSTLPPLTADSPSIGRLKKTVSKATPDTPLADQSITLYGYKYATGAAFETYGIKTLTDNSTQEGLVAESTYDAAGRLTSSTDAYGHKSITVYDGEGRVTRSTSADGYATYYYYDVFGRAYKERLHKPVKAAGGSLGVNQTVVNVLTYYDYDEAGRVVRTVRRKALPDGSDGDLISEIRAAYESDETGRAETQIDALGLKSVSIYDAGGRLARSESYDAGGRLLDWTAYGYDALGRPYKTSTRRGVATTNEYDNLGGLTKTTVSAPGYNDQVTEYAYDDAGRQTEVARFPGTSHKRTTYYTYDALGRVTKTETRNASGETIALEETDYDSKGRRHKVWTYADASDKTATWYEYDTQDRMTHTHLGYESGARTGLDFQFAYDDYGNVASFRNPLGRARTKFYDDRGRLWREFSPKCSDDANSPVYNKHMAKHYTYDQTGRVAQALEGVASEATAQSAIANARYVSYMYDPWTDRPTKATFRDGREKRFYYRADNGLPERTEVWKNGVCVYSRQYDYDEKTWRVCAVTTPEGKVQYEYNAYGQVSRLATSASQDVLYTYDATGRLQYVKGRDLSSD